MQEIDKLNVENDSKGKESVDMAAQIRAIEYDISKSLGKIDDLQRIIDQKSYDNSQKENQLNEVDADVARLKSQNNNYKNELDHLKGLEQRYRGENADLQRRNDDEGRKNYDSNNQIKDLEAQIRSTEDQIMMQRKDLDGARYQNSSLTDNNSGMQVEIDALNNHIRVLNSQNDDLTKELDHFVEANEAIRIRLDRKNRVLDLRQYNEAQLQKSLAFVNEAKSPPRHHRE